MAYVLCSSGALQTLYLYSSRAHYERMTDANINCINVPNQGPELNLKQMSLAVFICSSGFSFQETDNQELLLALL